MDINFTGIVEEILNLNMLKTESAPLVKLLNKYGIMGTKAMAFIMELCEVLKEMGENNAVDNTNG